MLVGVGIILAVALLAICAFVLYEEGMATMKRRRRRERFEQPAYEIAARRQYRKQIHSH